MNSYLWANDQYRKMYSHIGIKPIITINILLIITVIYKIIK